MRKLPVEAKKQIDATIELLDELLGQILGYIEERGERWQDSEVAGWYDDWTQQIEDGAEALRAIDVSPYGESTSPEDLARMRAEFELRYKVGPEARKEILARWEARTGGGRFFDDEALAEMEAWIKANPEYRPPEDDEDDDEPKPQCRKPKLSR